MHDHLTDRARKVMQLADKEAIRLKHEYIGTEHILLGLVREGSGVAPNVLNNLNIDLRKIRLEVEKIVQPGPDQVNVSKLPQTPRAKKVIEYSIEEARNLNHNYVGTEHLLLGLLREQEGVAAQVLMNLGLKLEDVREEVLNLLGHNPLPNAGDDSFHSPVWHPLPGVGLLGLPAPEFPQEIRPLLMELETPIETLTEEKEAAVAEGDFERAANLRDQADRLARRRNTILLDWRKKRMPDPSWLSWGGGTVAKVARLINDEGRWEELPVLADALEEAGCTDQEMLTHCRQSGEHERGCWVVALLLDKN